MKKKLLIFTIAYCITTCLQIHAQENIEDCGMLTYMWHNTDAKKSKILAIMTDDEYFPIEIKRGEYLSEKETANGEITISGQKVQLDSIYYFTKTWDPQKEIYNYTFEQKYKGAKYIEVEGVFIHSLLSDWDGIGVPYIGCFFWTTGGELRGYGSFQKDEEPRVTCNALGNWAFKNACNYLIDKKEFTKPPLFLYTFRVLTNENKEFIPTHIISSRKNPMAVDVPKRDNFSIQVTENSISIQAEEPIEKVVLTNMEGMSTYYKGEGKKQMDITPPKSKQNYIIRIEFCNSTKKITQKIYMP